MTARPATTAIRTEGLKMIKPGLKSAIFAISILFLTVIYVDSTQAQQQELSAQVIQIAGSTVYLSTGSDDSIVQGDTLYIYLEDALLGALVVQGAASKSLSAEFASDPFPLTRGQTIIIRFRKPIQTQQDLGENEEEVQSPAPTVSILESSAEPARQTDLIRPKLSGRVSFGGTALSTMTKWSSILNNRTDRWFATPYTNISALLSNIPGGLSIDASLSYSYRYSSTSSLNPSSRARFYRLNMEKTFAKIPLSIKAGRFYNRYEIFSGFWDGVMAKVGSRDNGVGLIAGFEPIRSNEGFQTDLPKYSIYTYQTFQVQNFRSMTELDFTAIMPRINLDNHLYAGAYQQFLLSRHRISVRLQADQNPQSKQWNFSQIMVRGSLELTNRLQLHGGYNRRQPYLMYNVDNPIGNLRTELTGGTMVRFNSGSIGGDVSKITSEVSPTAYSFSGYVQAYRTRLWNLGFSLNGQYWYSDNYSTTRLAPSINRDFKDLHLSLGYEFYQTDFISDKYQTHTIDLSAMVTLTPRWYFQADLRSGFGELFINNSLQFSFWRSF